MNRSLFAARSGFTLLELLTVLVIVLILAVMLVQSVQGWREQAERAKCVTNLSSLYVASTSYIQEQEHWPQIRGSLAASDPAQYAQAWYAALGKYGVSRAGFVCPTVQRALSSPNLERPENARVDYLATPFDNRRGTPYLWANQPWFIEKSSSHQGGNLMVFAGGHTLNLQEMIKARKGYQGQ